jgi:hypothetical protein
MAIVWAVEEQCRGLAISLMALSRLQESGSNGLVMVLKFGISPKADGQQWLKLALFLPPEPGSKPTR